MRKEWLETREILKVAVGQQNKWKFKHWKSKRDKASERDRNCFIGWVNGWRKMQVEVNLKARRSLQRGRKEGRKMNTLLLSIIAAQPACNKNSNIQQTIQLLLLPACLSEQHISFGPEFTRYCKLMMIPVLRSLTLSAAAAERMIRALESNWVSTAISNFITTANKAQRGSSMKRNLQGHCIHIFVSQTFSCCFLPDVDWIRTPTGWQDAFQPAKKSMHL